MKKNKLIIKFENKYFVVLTDPNKLQKKEKIYKKVEE